MPTPSIQEALMAIPSRLYSYLEQRGAQYDICEHALSRSSPETARCASILPHQLAKPVLLEDDAGYVMAVVPADRRVMIGRLCQELGRPELRLSDEDRIAALFEGCDRGAMPPLGVAWGIETLVDDEVEANEVVYLEAGDHKHLLRVSGWQFHSLMAGARHGQFCKAAIH
jgi:Ala-tRNA(Pro) deacylase